MAGSFARPTARSNARLTVAGRNGSPTSVVNTWPLSDQAGPAASRSSVCWLICDFNRDQTSAHELNVLDNVRRAAARRKPANVPAREAMSPGTCPRDDAGQD